MKNFDEQIVKVNWNDQCSIEESEKRKEDLEARGYEQVQTISGMNYAKLIYRKYE